MGDQSSHPDPSRLVAFLMNQDPLTTDEHHHFLHCEECTNRTADALLEELKKRSESEG
jgi:hypothetical protein